MKEEIEKAKANLWSKLENIINSRLPLDHGIESGKAYKALIKAYCEPPYHGGSREYHNVRHVLDCIKKLEEYHASENLDKETYDILFIAICYHDCVYKTDDSCHNEQVSALFAADQLMSFGLPYPFVSEVFMNILDTDHSRPVRNIIEAQIIRDIDMSGLGSPYLTFSENHTNVRTEYKNVSMIEFYKARFEFFKSLMHSSEPIFLTDYFRRKYQKLAKKNIQRKILELTDALKSQGIRV